MAVSIPTDAREWLDLFEVAPLELMAAKTRQRLGKQAKGLYERAIESVPDVTLGTLTLQPAIYRVLYRDRAVNVTRRELEVLLVLARATADGRRVMAGDLAGLVWGDGGDSDRNNLRTQLYRLRRKLPGLIVGESCGTSRVGSARGYCLAVGGEGQT